MDRPLPSQRPSTADRRPLVHPPGGVAVVRVGYAFVAIVLCLATAGCMGSWVLRGTRLRLNASHGDTGTQEMLLNIVRMRYGETPTFMDLEAITSQTEASLNGIGGQKSALTGTLLGKFKLRDAPTLTYQPRTGNDLADSMLKAIPPERILEVAPGNDTRIFLMAFVETINGVHNSPTATSPGSRMLTPNDEFRYIVDTFMSLQTRGAVRLRVGERTVEAHEPLPVKNPGASETLTAAKKEYHYTSASDRTGLMGHSEFVAVMIRPEDVDAADTIELTRMLGLVPSRQGYEVRSLKDDTFDFDTAYAAGLSLQGDPLALPGDVVMRPDASVGPLDVFDDLAPDSTVPVAGLVEAITMDVRSPYQAMAYLSKGVDVPAAHVRRGTVQVFCGPDGKPFDGRSITRGLFHVCVQKHRPLQAEVAVHYRGYWFYISQGDVASRSTLNFMRLVAEIQSKSGSLPEAYALPD